MIAYALRRMTRIPLVLLATFVPALLLVRVVPGGPWDPARKLPLDVETMLLAGCRAGDAVLSQVAGAVLAWIRLDVDGCTGRSLRDTTPVLTLLERALPSSMSLVTVAATSAIVAGLVTGAILARLGVGARARAGSASLAVVEAMPVFMLAPMCVLLGSLVLGLFAPARALTVGTWSVAVTALAAPFAASSARVVRDALRNPAAEARRRADLARGMSRRRAALRAVRLALLPLAAHVGATMSAIIMGSMAVELVFDMPGLGPLVIDAAHARDVNVLLGGTFTYAALVLVANLVVELVYGLLDPRVRSRR